MRKLVLLLAILALPGLAFGQVSLDVGVGGVPGGVSGGGAIAIDVLLNTPIPLDGVQYSLSAELNGMGAGSGDALVTYDVITPWVNGTTFTGLGGDYTQLIGVGAGNGMTMAAMNMMGPELYFKSFGTTPAPLAAALVATYNVTVAPLNPGDVLVITAGADPMGMFGNGYSYAGGTQGGPFHPGLGLTIPEPASILLLLGALPFLRRRR
jgi:hypothetical protein